MGGCSCCGCVFTEGWGHDDMMICYILFRMAVKCQGLKYELF